MAAANERTNTQANKIRARLDNYKAENATMKSELATMKDRFRKFRNRCPHDALTTEYNEKTKHATTSSDRQAWI